MELKDVLNRIHQDEDGATATEYLVLLILVACFVIAVVKAFGSTISTKFDVSVDVVRREVTF